MMRMVAAAIRQPLANGVSAQSSDLHDAQQPSNPSHELFFDKQKNLVSI